MLTWCFSLFCLFFRENRQPVFALKRTSLGSLLGLRSSMFRREFAEFSKAEEFH